MQIIADNLMRVVVCISDVAFGLPRMFRPLADRRHNRARIISWLLLQFSTTVRPSIQAVPALAIRKATRKLNNKPMSARYMANMYFSIENVPVVRTTQGA